MQRHPLTNSRAKIEIFKDGRRLYYTAIIIYMDDKSVTFRDRDGRIFDFSREYVKEIAVIEEGAR